MMRYLLLAMISTSVCATDKDIEVISITNSPTWKVDAYTRAGQTNLVCDTRVVGDSIYRIWTFFHNEVKVAEIEVAPNREEFRSEPGSPYSARWVLFKVNSPHSPKFVSITAKDGVVLDLFEHKDGIYLPSDQREIREVANGQRKLLKRVRELEK